MQCVITKITNLLNNKDSPDRRRSISQKRNVENTDDRITDDKKIKTKEDAEKKRTDRMD